MKRRVRQQALTRRLPHLAPLLAKFQALAKRADKQFRGTLRGFDNIGLIVADGAPCSSGGYYCSPLNSKCFAFTGGEGVHFSFLAEKQDVHFDELPVIVTIPMAFGNPNFIAGESLREFLSLGIYRGYFGLEQLGYQLQKTLDVYSNPEWKAEAHSEFWVGFGVSELKAKVLTFLRTELQLDQWPDLRERFFELQEKYMPMLRTPKAE